VLVDLSYDPDRIKLFFPFPVALCIGSHHYHDDGIQLPILLQEKKREALRLTAFWVAGGRRGGGGMN
jgi:hypothetical protein